MKLSRFIVSVASVIFGYADGCLYIPLFKRASRATEPYSDCWSLPGGPIGADETFEQACHRKLRQDLGLSVEYLEQLYTFGEPSRDPRDRAISVSYFALIKMESEALASGSNLKALLQWTNQQEGETGDCPMGKHLERSPVKATLRKLVGTAANGGNAEHHEAHM